MKKKYALILNAPHWVFIIVFFVQSINGQVGINTTTPDASAILEISSTTKGMLAPRMTTAQKLAIVSPANGLMVYDTDLKSYSYYDMPVSSWVNLNSGRNKFKRIKSTDVLATVLASELAAGGGSKYLLDTQTYYEINGAVMVDFPIELNNAYLVGLDSGEDKLIKTTGDLFTGTTGGAIKVITLVASSGNVFNINGGGTQNLIFRDLIIASSANVGVLQNFGLVFASIIQFVGNTNGIIYRDISKLLLNNQGWFGNNSGTYEKFEGTFSSLQKQGGFTEVVGASIGMDVSSNPTITVDGTVDGVNFTGAPTTGFFVKRYTVGSYTGFNFNNKWDVNCSGIPFEGDSYAVGDINYDYAVGFGALTTLSGTPVKLSGTTTSNNLYRASRGGVDNRIQYLGNKKRFFRVSGAASFQASATNTIYIFFVAKNGTVINQSKVYVNSNSTTDILAVPIQTIVELSPNDYIEVFAQRFSGSGNILTVSMNLIMN